MIALSPKSTRAKCRCVVPCSSTHRSRSERAPGQNALAKLAEVAASVARTASEHRDLIGMCRFDEGSCDIVRPGRGNRHLIRLLNRCAENGGQPPATSVAVRTNCCRWHTPLPTKCIRNRCARISTGSRFGWRGFGRRPVDRAPSPLRRSTVSLAAASLADLCARSHCFSRGRNICVAVRTGRAHAPGGAALVLLLLVRWA